jgi:hypothetical protein
MVGVSESFRRERHSATGSGHIGWKVDGDAVTTQSRRHWAPAREVEGTGPAA